MYNHSADENKSNDKNGDWMEEQFSQNESNLRDSMSNNDVQRKKKTNNKRFEIVVKRKKTMNGENENIFAIFVKRKKQ